MARLLRAHANRDGHERGIAAPASPRLRELYLKIGRDFEARELNTEIERTTWLGAIGVRVPEVLSTFYKVGLFATVMTAVTGTHPQHCALARSRIVDMLAQAMAALHALPVAECPFKETIAVRLARANEMIERGLIQPEHFAERNRGLAPRQIYDRMAASRPPHEDLVVVHGDACFDNLLIDPHAGVGFVDCGRCGVGDRYLDLVNLTEDIDAHFGRQWTQRFLRAYGVTRLDPAKARFFSDLYELF